MSPLHENSQADVVRTLARASKLSPKQLKKAVDTLSADELINLVASVEAGNIKQALSIVQLTDVGQKTSSVENQKNKLLSIARDKTLGSRTQLQQMMSIIGDVDPKNWQLIYSTLEPDTLQKLYYHVAGRKTPNVSRTQAFQILSHAKESIMEQVVYENQIVDVRVPNGPNNTIGIMLGSTLTMVPAGECVPLNEHVMGMTPMPSLARMLTLAGVDTLPEQSAGVTGDKLPMGLRVVVEFDPERPMDNTRVKILNVDATVTLEGLRMRISRQYKDLSVDLSSGSPDYSFALANAQRLTNSLDTMVAALQDIKQIRQAGGARSRNIPEVLENEDN
jgi:hypothetical protein